MANDAETSRDRWAIRTASNGSEERALAAYAARMEPRTFVRFEPRNDEDLDADLCAGRYSGVLFADLNALLTMVWQSHAQVERWIDAGVRIELAKPPGGGSNGSWPPVVVAVCDSLIRWRRTQRTRKLIAAVLFSALALVAAAVLLWLVPPGG
jgi:hypothetical protein